MRLTEGQHACRDTKEMPTIFTHANKTAVVAFRGWIEASIDNNDRKFKWSEKVAENRQELLHKGRLLRIVGTTYAAAAAASVE